MNIGSRLIKWYFSNKRELPWRNTNDPYIIWISEIILQQTRVVQGIEYFYRFTEAFPDVESLANADENEVLKLWQGLGYYSRARNLHHSAKQIMSEFNGVFPDNHDDILKLKGIGEYTSAAIASFAFGQAYPVLDGNVFRFLARYFGIETPVNTSEGKKQFSQIANELLDKKYPGLFNQSIMEFGALQCKPASPDCSSCPLMSSCFAYKNKKTALLPVKIKSKPVKIRHFNYLFIEHENYVYLKQRSGNDIWKNLYDFPLIETDVPLNRNSIEQHSEWKSIFNKTNFSIQNDIFYIEHQLSHRLIKAVFWKICLKGKKDLPFIKVPESDLFKFPVSRLIELFLEKNFQKDLFK